MTLASQPPPHDKYLAVSTLTTGHTDGLLSGESKKKPTQCDSSCGDSRPLIFLTHASRTLTQRCADIPKRGGVRFWIFHTWTEQSKRNSTEAELFEINLLRKKLKTPFRERCSFFFILRPWLHLLSSGGRISIRGEVNASWESFKKKKKRHALKCHHSWGAKFLREANASEYFRLFWLEKETPTALAGVQGSLAGPREILY